jgi:hypothetical protein
MAAVRPNRRPVALTYFVSEYIIVAACLIGFTAAELASNAANMSAPFLSNFSSIKL